MLKYTFLAILILLFSFSVGYAASYTANGDGTVSDQDSGLMWQQQNDSTGKNWHSALDYCNNLTLGGYSDWRLPNKKALESIVDYTTYNPAINPVFTGTSSNFYWSSTSHTGDPDYKWLVSFVDGSVDYYTNTYNYYARCVR